MLISQEYWNKNLTKTARHDIFIIELWKGVQFWEMTHYYYW
jgi:hypothetical protein